MPGGGPERPARPPGGRRMKHTESQKKTPKPANSRRSGIISAANTPAPAIAIALAFAMLFSLCACTAGGPGTGTASSGNGTGGIDAPRDTSEPADSSGGEHDTSAPGTSSAPERPVTGGIFLGTGPLSDYSIVFDPRSAPSLNAAHILAEAILGSCGAVLTLLPGGMPANGRAITVGSSSGGYGGSGSGWRIAGSGGNLEITASSPLLLLNACTKLAGVIAADEGAFRNLPDGYLLEEACTGADLLAGTPGSRIDRSEGSDIRIMSFNILHENYNNKLPLSGRDAAVASVISAYAPDAVGLQEVSEAWHDALERLFGGSYVFIPDLVDGTGRSYSTIIYNTSKAELLEYGTTVYSACNNVYLRNLTWARFRRLSDRQEYIVTSTHWDINSNADNRVVQVKENGVLNSQIISKYGLPVFSCGDYNRAEDTAEFKSFIAATGMADSKLSAIAGGSYDRAGKSTHTVGSDISGNSTGAVCIDHIVCTSGVKVVYYTTVTDPEAIGASDHCPIFIDAQIGNTKTSGDPALDTPAAPSALTAEASLPASGSGTYADPYIIACADNLRYLRDSVAGGESFLGKYFSQTADIDLGNAEWVPIGPDQGHPFSGVYDGNGHSVSGMRITVCREQNGLFGYITSYDRKTCSVSGLTVRGSITLTKLVAGARIGGLCGSAGLAVSAAGTTVLTSVRSEVEVSVTAPEIEPRIGGLAGFVSSARVSGCENAGMLNISLGKASRAGGIAGQATGATFSRCSNRGGIRSVSEAASYAGGIVGIYSFCDFLAGSLYRCTNEGEILSQSSAAAAYAGGIAGQGYSSGDTVNLKITNCVNRAKVTAKVTGGSKLAYGAGIIAYCSKKSFTVDSCVNTAGDVSGTSPAGSRSGGIFGVFNLPDAESPIVCSNCVTVGPLYGYNKNTLRDNREKVSATEAEAAAAAVLGNS